MGHTGYPVRCEGFGSLNIRTKRWVGCCTMRCSCSATVVPPSFSQGAVRPHLALYWGSSHSSEPFGLEDPDLKMWRTVNYEHHVHILLNRAGGLYGLLERSLHHCSFVLLWSPAVLQPSDLSCALVIFCAFANAATAAVFWEFSRNPLFKEFSYLQALSTSKILCYGWDIC